MQKNIFKGEKAIFNYLTPGATGPTPIIELPSRLNPYLKDDVHIYIKLIQSVPLSNIKSIPAWYMLSAIPEKELKNINDLVEYSSGNMALSLTILSRHFGIKNMHTIITPDVPKNKQNLLKLLGTDLIISDGPSCPDVRAQLGGVWEATQMGKQPGWKNLGQYSNANIPKGTGQRIGGEIFKQLGNKLDIFCAAIGTSGTVYGISSYLKKKIPKLYVIAASGKKGSSIPGPRTEEHVKKLHFPWAETVDLEFPIGTEDAFGASLKLIREGIFVGPSSGMQLAATLEVLKKMKKENRLKKNTNAVILGCDTMFPYIEEYFDILPEILKK
ncbi:MAG: pyridoxal-phosphate dependent enzyme [Candidatus Pacebacteria bacterium]|nr:pyridoxal-phosphate dependent enzyme [Candidatus Paceibacterota bacterium]